MKWHFDNDRAIYLQIMEQITLSIVSGELKPGAKLLSVRELAQEAGVNPNTMQKALAELENTGLVYSSRTYGRFITADSEKIAQEKEKTALYQADAFINQMKSLGLTMQETQLILEKIGW